MAQIDIELAKLKETKASIAQSITAKGGTLSNPSDFSSYSVAIDNLPSSGGGSDFEQIGDATTPEPLKSGLEYAKQIKDTWDDSITNCGHKYANDKQLYFFPVVNTANVDNMNYMFSNSNILVAPTLHTPKCTDLNGTFSDCVSLLYADLSSWTLSKVVTVSFMFEGCDRVSTIILPKGLRPTYAERMFYNCYDLTQVNIKDIDFSQCTNMSDAFYNCKYLTVIPRLNTGNCTKLVSIFSGSNNLVRVEGIDMKSVSGNQSLFGSLYSDNKKLRYLLIKHFGNSNMSTSYTYFKRLSYWGSNDATNTDAKQSVIDTFITYSIDRSSNPMTITLHSNTYSILTADEIQRAANKGYNLTK